MAVAARMATAAGLFLTVLSPFASSWHSVLVEGR